MHILVAGYQLPKFFEKVRCAKNCPMKMVKLLDVRLGQDYLSGCLQSLEWIHLAEWCGTDGVERMENVCVCT